MEVELHVPPAATMPNAGDLHRQCLEILQADGPIVIDVSAIRDADLSLLQLIASLRAAAEAAGRGVRLRGPAPAPVAALLERAGFLAAASPQDLDFWFHGEPVQ